MKSLIPFFFLLLFFFTNVKVIIVPGGDFVVLDEGVQVFKTLIKFILLNSLIILHIRPPAIQPIEVIHNACIRLY